MSGSDRRSTVTPEQAAEAIGVPVAEWPGRCHEIAGLCLAAGLVEGRLRYGMWIGRIHPRSHFKGRTLTHHGWVEVEPPEDDDPLAGLICATCDHTQDEHALSGFFKPCQVESCEGCDDFQPKHAGAHVFDPTRWVFEAVEPYIFQGEDRERWYDVAGGGLAAALLRPYPTEPEPWEAALRPESKRRADVTLEMEPPHPLRLAVLIHSNGGPAVAMTAGRKMTLPARGVAWLANLPVRMLGMDTAAALYDALKATDNEALIPIDNLEMVKGDGFYGRKQVYVERVAKVKRAAKKRKKS
jgi:hypothetical protein